MMDTNIIWNDDLSPAQWDDLLAKLKGHPLQSALWGESRKESCKIKYQRWAAFKNDQPVFLARFEERALFKFIKVAWTPKGPVNLTDDLQLQEAFFQRLKEKGFLLCVTNPWQKIETPPADAFYTVWVDLTVGKEQLWMNLHKQCRNDVKRAKKFGVNIEKSTSAEDLEAFYAICESISKSKGFSLGDASRSMPYLLANQNSSHPVASCLFVARQEGKVCGGAFLMVCGKSVHYLWGAVDRTFAHLCVGEALQWGIIEWAFDNHFKKYDLEGISAKQDGGVDRFKKKLGGTVIAYPGMQFYPLGTGRLLASLMKMYFSWNPLLTRIRKSPLKIFK